MPDVLTDEGVMMSFPIRYGRTDFYDHNTKPIREDVPIEPKATQTFTFEETNIIGYEAWRRNNKKNDPLKLEVWFSHLSFGDGTGFTSMGALPFPFKEEEVGRCFENLDHPCFYDPIICPPGSNLIQFGAAGGCLQLCVEPPTLPEVACLAWGFVWSFAAGECRATATAIGLVIGPR